MQTTHSFIIKRLVDLVVRYLVPVCTSTYSLSHWWYKSTGVCTVSVTVNVPTVDCPLVPVGPNYLGLMIFNECEAKTSEWKENKYVRVYLYLPG
jgi:hypothetical protein